MAATIELYLVRHAIAAERGPKYPDDRLRPLTPAGSKKFAESVSGLVEMDVVIDFVLTSALVDRRLSSPPASNRNPRSRRSKRSRRADGIRPWSRRSKRIRNAIAGSP